MSVSTRQYTLIDCSVLINEEGDFNCSLHDELIDSYYCMSQCPKQSSCDTFAWAGDDHKLLEGEAWKCSCGAVNDAELYECPSCGAIRLGK